MWERLVGNRIAVVVFICMSVFAAFHSMYTGIRLLTGSVPQGLGYQISHFATVLGEFFMAGVFAYLAWAFWRKLYRA